MKVLDSRYAGAWATAGLANLMIALPVAWALVGRAALPIYASSVQEDGVLEWMTAWGFLIAGLLFARAAWRARQGGQRFPWFTIGLSVFCGFVALEEISWGQRLMGFRPPAYFLEHSYQLEFNLHNLFDGKPSALGAKLVIVGYGILLPLLYQPQPTRRLLERLGILVPPPALLPGFVFMLMVYRRDPFKSTAELVELMLATAFLFSALSTSQREPIRVSPLQPPLSRARQVLVASLVVAALGSLSSYGSMRLRFAHPGNLAAAQTELEALEQDLLALARERSGDLSIDCGRGSRIYRWVKTRGFRQLRSGRFVALQTRGLPERRADYFLDPWNLPYRIRRSCSSSREVIRIYSYGPNRKGEGNDWEPGGDDIGAVIDLEPAAPSVD